VLEVVQIGSVRIKEILWLHYFKVWDTIKEMQPDRCYSVKAPEKKLLACR
jgi:hypothetical protein